MTVNAIGKGQMSWFLLIPAMLLLALHSGSRNAVWGGATLGAIAGVIIAMVRPGFDWWTVGNAMSIGTLVGGVTEWLPRIVSTLRTKNRRNRSAEVDIPIVKDLKAELEQKRRELQLLNDPETICGFGEMAYDGDGVDQSFIEAASWFRIAAEAGNVRATQSITNVRKR